MAKKRIGILTGGGDVPGLNSVIKTVVYRGAENGIRSHRHPPWLGGVDARQPQRPRQPRRYILPLTRENTRTIDRDGGTYAAHQPHQSVEDEKAAGFLGGRSFPQSPRRRDLHGVRYDAQVI